MIVLTTTDSKKSANLIAKKLILKALSPCIQIKKIKSIYIWKGKICIQKEFLLLIKSKKSSFKKIEKTIKKYHSYDTPEIVSIKIDKMNKKYKKWLKNSLKKEKK